MTAENDEADERWREVFFALLKRANLDAEFRARVEATGAVIHNFEAVLASSRVAHALPSGAITCTEYWWGFQLEIPHAILAEWAATTIDSEPIATAIGSGVGPSAPFRRRVATLHRGPARRAHAPRSRRRRLHQHDVDGTEHLHPARHPGPLITHASARLTSS